MSELLRRLDALSPRRRALLTLRLARRAGLGASPVQDLQALPIRPLPRTGEALPLSFAQERLWFFDRLESRRGVYNMAYAVPVGAGCPGRLGRSLDEAVRRHEVLRAVFPPGEPRQQVLPFRPRPLPVVDLAALPAAIRDAEHGRLRQEEGERPFDLARGPLLRTSLLRLSADESVLLVNFHHMVSDGWSMWVLMAEVAAAYEGGAPLPDLPVQYADFAAWQREVLAGGTLDGLAAFWRETLAGVPDRLELPADRPRPPVQSFRGSVVPLSLRSGEAIPGLCRSRGATLFMVLLAAFQALLRRWSGQGDLIVGAVAANRGRSDVEGLIGCFVNTLALPARMPAGTTFDELLAQVRTAALGGYAHQDLPFEKLVDELKVERSLAWSPLVQVMFVLQNTPAERHRLAGRELHPEEIHSGTSKLDLTLSVTEGDLTGFIEYASDLFDGSTIRRMAAHFETLLAAVVTSPECRLEDLPLLPEAERHQLLAEWNDTALLRAEDSCLHELIEAQVDRTPDAVAVVGEQDTLTYRQLDRRANALAWRLRSLGVGPDALVGISAERSPSMIVGLLAILKAGGGYVPLDPEYPGERLAFMLEDSAVPVLLALPHRLAQAGRFSGTVVPLGGDEEDDRRPLSGALPESAAYAIYTSGSTGRPKGAVNSHRAIVNRLLWMQEEYELDASDRVLQKTPFSFDVSVWELFWPLMTGARLVFALPGGHRDAAYLVDRIATEGITTLHFVPSMLQVFLEERGLDRCGSLCRVIASGEALPPDLADRFVQRLGPLGARLHNLYGPTEAAVDVTFRSCPGGERRVPIGRPIANLRIHILDREGQPASLAPIAVPGELLIGGAGLARGYLRRPGLTAERFVPDPLGPPGERLYRTGDLARYLPSGEIEYLGRLDHQVKIRGVRIEPGEIEAVLAEHPAVREAVTLARDGSLAAFLVLRESVPVADLRAWARERLPEALVPSAWAVLDALPLTPNGKADRKALSALSLQPAEGTAWAPPRTPLEELLVGLWEELLGLERTGIHDRFFDLGGHSLLATRLIGRLGARLGIDVPLRAVFAAPTPAALAAWLEEGQGMPALPPVRPVPRETCGRALPLSFAQERVWFLERLEPGQAAYNIPFAYRLEGSLDVPDLERRLTAVIRRHEALRTVFRETGGEPRQEILPPRAFSLPVIDINPQGGLPELDRLIEDEVRRPFDLSAEAPLRACLIRLDGRTSVLLFNLHHAAGDGWSLEILAEELEAVSPLPELPVQYADFAAWQREQLSGEVLGRQVGWWREELAGAPALLELPADRPRPPLQTYRGSSLDFVLPAELAAAAKAFSRRQGATAFMVLFAAFQALLHRLTGQEDLLVGTVVANRRRAELEGLIGLFVNTLVLRGRTREEEGFGALVERARSTALGVYAHQDLPFERLIEELGVPRSLACSPLFQVMFTLESAPRRPLALPGVEAAPFPLPSFTSKFDLTLYLTESQGGLAGTLEYATDLFDRATVGRLAGQLRELLAGALADPGRPVADLPLLAEAERRQLRDWSSGPVEEPAPVNQAFEEQARRTPDAVAVVCGGESLTYAELDLRAGRLARHLRDLGAGPDVLVGIALERSADMLVAVLGVLKSGAAWLPLDPSNPQERLAAILEDARPPLLIGDLESGARRVRLDDAHGEPLHSQHDEEALPDHLAYAIFTSGSTGRPKGVLVRRGALANFLASMRRAPGLSSDDVLLAVTTLSFDISILELLLPLLVGGRVVIARRDEAADPARLRGLLDESGATAMQATPATWRLLLESGWPVSPGAGGVPPPGEGEGWLWGEVRRGAPRSETSVAFGTPPPLPSPAAREREPPPSAAPKLASRPRLKALCGGEALPSDLARQLLGRVGSLWNLYGPTETTVWSAASEVRLDRLESAFVPIRGPVDRTALVLVDHRLQPVPPGVAGEILIGGEGLARGYLGRPGLTAERFVPDPFGAPGSRAYRTGDLARRRPSGEIDFLGRIDNQVKLRGFRIELGEIEAALAAHPAVREAVVLARGSAEERTLEAFLVLDGEAPGLPGFLRARLPEYMVPSAWTVLESLPLNANGKVDRRALAALERRDAVSAEPSALPRTSAEELLAGIWADVLGRERVGTRDSFFDLGGHSLLGSRVLARVANAFGVDLPLRTLFEAPTIAALAERIETAGRRRQAPPIRPISRGGDLPLSFAQERLWVLDRLQPGGAAYNVFEPYRLRGPLTRAHREALARALEEIVARHEALRAVFPEKDGAPVQMVLPPAPRPLPEIDLRGLPDRQEEAGRLLDAELRRPFDLARGPLLRALLLRVTDDDSLLAVSLHHIVSDGWSLGVLADELSVLTEVFLEGRPSPLSPLPVQYADYAAWQRGWLRGEALDEQLAWWKQEMEGLPALLELPSDWTRPAVWSDRLGSLRMDLSPELARALRDLSRRRGATLFMTLLAGLQALLHRLTGRADVPVGTPVAGRVRPELEGLIGLFVNTLALRVRMPRTFEALLGSVRSTSLEALARQDVPFEKLVEELRLPRSLSHNPLFQVLLAYQNVPSSGLRLPGLEAAPLEVGSAAARLDLSLIFFETPEGLGGLLEYASALFDAPTAGRLVSALLVLLEAAAADPALPLSDLPLLSPAERLQLAADGSWDGTASTTALELFEAVATSRPDAPAVLFEGERLTYGELRGRAERLARRLRARGVGRESVVALFLDRSPELIVAMLGVLRAGGAYLALDPEYPAERIRLALEDSGSGIVLSSKDLEEGPEEGGEMPWPDPGDLAYILYTSGSTGRPKGVLVEHRGIPNLVEVQARFFDVRPGDRVLQFASPSFDASVSEIWTALGTGAILVMATRDDLLPGPRLVRRMREQGVTHVTLAPSLLATLPPPESIDLPDLRTVVVAGEACPPELARRWAATRRVVNGYGPTEGTVCATLEEVAATGPIAERLSIGRPVARIRVYVLDPGLEPLPDGVPGELCLGGIGLARGYHGRPDLTAERFMPDPLAGFPGARIYRTGDLARRLPDGRLDFLGRIDHQIKLRGLRIEPGEIEAALVRQPGVRECVVLVRGQGDGRRLVAFAAPEGPERPSQLREALARELPAHLVPSAVVLLDALPLTPNGKVDRQALTRLEADPAVTTVHVAPRTPTEAGLADLWADLLGLESVGVHDVFFELGGHSLLGIRLLARVADRFGVELPLRALFEAPSPGELASRIDAARAEGGAPAAPPVVPVSRGGKLPLSFSQERLWFLDRLLADRAAYNLPLVLGLSGRLDRAALGRALEEIVRRHEALRTTFREAGGEPWQEIHPPGPFPLPEIDLGALWPGRRAAELDRLQEGELRQPFDLGRGPLIRVRLVRLEEREAVLLLTLHHIVGDGWSIGVLLEEIRTLYASSPLPELPVQFADFAAWQRRWLQGEALASRLAFWTRELAGAPTRLDLPADRARPAVLGSRGDERSRPLPDALASELRALARQQGATLFMVLLAGFQTLLHRLTGQDDVLVGSPFAGRHRAETERLIGFFVNTLVLRGRMPAGTRFRDLVERARATTLAAYAHQDLPFEKLVEELRIERSLSHTPLFQVLFTFQEALPESFEADGLRLRPLPVGTVAVKFDLGLTLAETPGGGLVAMVRHLRDLFDNPTPPRFLEQLRTLLEAAVADPERPLAHLPLLPETESQQVLREWNDTGTESPAGWTVVRRFEEWAERTPDAPALAFEGEVLSYRELAERTGRLAARLREMGVGPEVLVAVRLERSLGMIEAVLGVLRAGGAYVPIDPDLPAERVAFLVEDSGARIVLTEERLRAMMEDPSPALPCFAGEGELSPGGGALAYAIYTSGSTGRPKGVAVEHRQLASYLDGVLERMALPPGSSYATVSTIAADLGNTVVYAALATGGCLHVISRERLADGDALGEYFDRHGVDCLKIVPSHLEALLASSRPASCLPRRLLLLGGESTRWELADRIRALAPDCRLLNHYGPTETTVGVLTREIVPSEMRRQPNIPLGRPIPGTRIALLDRNGEPVPMGVPGELHVGGDNVSRGYPGRPELTASRFLPAPWGEPGARLYATGDLARRRPDGVIEFLGRIDHQVKIRGYRVEPGEIEAALAAHPAVQGAAVLAREAAPGTPGDTRLVAFVATSVRTEELAAWLRGRLPDAMVPSVFVPLDALPLTPNGKVDRRALEALAVSPVPPIPDTEDDAPRTPAEEIVAGIFAHLLGRRSVGCRGHFFDLGGHSLLATRALSRLRDAFEVELSLRALFEDPTVAGIAARIEAALTGGEEILAPPIRPVSRDGDLPLSFAQERLWLLDRLEPGRAVYNVPLAVRISGPLDLAALERSLAGIVRRHEVLRSRFPEEDGRPVQQVLPFAGFSLPRVDLRGLPDGSREALRIVEEEARRPFELGRGPLLRAAVLLTPDIPEEAVLSLHLHHIVSDGWSRGLFLAELSALYAGRSLPELPVQYADFAAWQREWLRGDVLERQIAFWKVELDGAPRLLELPSDRPRPAAQSFRGGRRTLELPAGSARGVRDLARRQGATLFMTLLAAWQALLGRLSGQDDVLVGTPVSGRNRSEIEELIGFFVNTLVLRGGICGGSEVAEGSTFRDLVGHAKTVALSAYAHQELPFERLVEELSVERSLSHNPLFQVMFSLEDQPSRSGAGLDLAPVDLETGTAKFDLGLAAAAGDGRLDLSLEYAADLFDPATAERMLGWLATFLACAIAEPDARAAELPLLGAGERQQLLREWNDSFLDTSGPLVHHQVEAWAARLPDAEAVEGISYGELSSRANRLAHRLRRLGVKPESRVGVLLERSADLIVAELAVLKAGGAFVPLDASHPAARMAFTLEDSRCPVLLARESLIPDALRERPDVRILPPESWGEEGDPASNPEPWATDRNLAYVIYTSGSTGKPKGVEIEHASLRNLASWHRIAYGVGPADRASLVSSPAFDASVWEVWPYLASGAALRIPDEETRTHPGRLVAWFAEQEITLGFLSAPMAEAAWAETWPADMPLRIVFTGADKVHQGPPPGLRLTLVNAYGPTEATVVTTAYDVAPGEVSPPIGRAFANARVILLDSRLQPVPLGVPGELCVAGPGLARGYAGRPDLTAERFVPDPLGEGGRLYRTGDLARWRADGNLEYLGRMDQQVKIRGFRIEPGEVESALSTHPGLRAAAVLAVGTVDRRLVAYVVPAEDGPAPAGLRSWLAERLPEPMVPSAWVTLPELPLTPSGKVDRRALSGIEPEPAEETFDLPATPTEEILCAVWSELLQVERVGTGANFFDLGGHSLKATQLVSRVASALGVDLPVRAVFETPTVAALAARIDELRLAGEGLQAPPILPVSRELDLPLSFNQEPLWFLHRLDPDSASYNVFTPLRLQGELDESALQAALAGIVRRHEPLRTVFQVRDGVPLQRILPPSGPAPVADLRALPREAADAEARRLAREEGSRPFDLVRGPAFRPLLVRTAPASSLLLLNAHHIATDGWSTGVLLRELSALYSGLPVPELPVQYADFAVWQRGWLQGEILERQIAYWRRELAGSPPVIALPTDRPRPASPTSRGGVAALTIPAEAAGPIREAGRRLGATLFMTCLAAFQLLLHRYSGQDDVVVGTPVANRGHRETEDLVGCFVNTLALRGRFDRSEDGLTFRGLLARVRASALDAYVHQDLPFDKVVDALKVERSLRWNPVFQVFFALSPPAELPGLAGLGVDILDDGAEVSKFDLSLGLGEVGEEIWGGIRYSADLFDAATVETMLSRYRALLEQAAAEPDRPLAELAPWNSERLQVLAEPELPEEEALESRLAARGRKVEDLRSNLSDAKKAKLASLLKRGRSGKP